MRGTLAAIIGAAFLALGADAQASVGRPFGMITTPWWWGEREVTELVSPDPLAIRWYEGDGDVADETADLDLPCGLFLDGEPRLTLFDDPRWREPPAATVVAAWHTDKLGNVIEYEQIPRRWDRPIDYNAYTYPIGGWARVASGYDLDLPDELQRRGTMRAVGHGGVDLPQALGTRITMIPLAHQIGDAKVVHVGQLFGNTVVTLHTVREGGERRHYVLLFGHLDDAAPGLRPGQRVRAGELVGFVGDSESPELVHLHLEARRLRDDVDPTTLTGYGVLAHTIVTDPRNVLPMKPVVTRPPSCKERLLAQRRSRLYGDLRLELAPMGLEGSVVTP